MSMPDTKPYIVTGLMVMRSDHDPIGIYLPERYIAGLKTRLLLGVKKFTFHIEPEFYDLDWNLLTPVECKVIYDSYKVVHTYEGRVVSFSVE